MNTESITAAVVAKSKTAVRAHVLSTESNEAGLTLATVQCWTATGRWNVFYAVFTAEGKLKALKGSRDNSKASLGF